MRRVNNLSDVQTVLNELLDWRSTFTTKNIDLKQRKITNAAAATDQNDYVILKQLPDLAVENNKTEQHYTQVFSNGGILAIGQDIPPFVAGHERTGTPTQIWVAVRTAPSGGPFTINMQLNGVDMLVDDLVLPAGSTGPVISSSFINPLPVIKYLSTYWPTIIVVNGAAAVSIGLVVKRGN